MIHDIPVDLNNPKSSPPLAWHLVRRRVQGRQEGSMKEEQSTSSLWINLAGVAFSDGQRILSWHQRENAQSPLHAEAKALLIAAWIAAQSSTKGHVFG